MDIELTLTLQQGVNIICPTCGPAVIEQHPRKKNVVRCHNCKEWLIILEME